MYHIFVRSSAGGHSGCFSVLAIMNSVAVNIGLHISFQLMFSSGCMPTSGTEGSYGI